MLKFVAMCVFVVWVDRWFPWTVVKAAPQFWEGSMSDIGKRYGLVKFPRTALAALTCIATGIEMLAGIGQSTRYLISIGFMFAFLVSAAVDTWRARKPGPG
jgi:hypothetical protein